MGKKGRTPRKTTWHTHKQNLACSHRNSNDMQVHLSQMSQDRFSYNVFEPCHNKTYILHIENNGTVQLRSNCKADQHFCFHFTDSKLSTLLSKSKISSLLCACTAQFVSYLLGNQIVCFLMRWFILFLLQEL